MKFCCLSQIAPLYSVKSGINAINPKLLKAKNWPLKEHEYSHSKNYNGDI